MAKKPIKPKPSKPASTVSPATSVPAEMLAEWNHYSGFLCAAAGVCLTQEKVIGRLSVRSTHHIAYNVALFISSSVT